MKSTTSTRSLLEITSKSFIQALLHSKLTIVFVLFLLYSMTIKAQTITRCATMEVQEQLYRENPLLKKSVDSLREVTHRIAQTQALFLRSDEILTIPVVVHVVWYHTNKEDSISQRQVESQIEALNTHFTNTNFSQVPEYFRNVAKTPNIRFCLARKDPNGGLTDGIKYYKRNRTTPWPPSTLSIKESVPNWNPQKYLNIWVCDIGKSSDNKYVLGWSSFPTSQYPPIEQGVVIDYTCFGTTGANLDPSFNEGKTTVHEVGHYLGLHHIWGDEVNGGCSDDDNFSDTPYQDSENVGYLTGRKYSCISEILSGGDMYMNYMDYTNDACLLMFTQQQVAEMRTTLTTTMASLLNSDGCGISCQAPTNLRGINNNNTITWDKVESARSYIVEIRPVGSDNWDWIPMGELKYDTRKLENGWYEIRVHTYCHGDIHSDNTPILKFEKIRECLKPIVKATRQKFGVSLSWEDMEYDLGREVRYRRVGDTNWLRPPVSSVFLDDYYFNDNFCAGIEYEVKVRRLCEKNPDIWGEWSDIIRLGNAYCLRTCETPVITQVTDVTRTSVVIHFEGVENVNYYWIEIRDKRTYGWVNYVTMSRRPFPIHYLEEGVEYEVAIHAECYRGGTSEWSNKISFKTGQPVNNCSSFKFDPNPITIGIYYPCDTKPYTAPTIGGREPLKYKWSNGSAQVYLPGNQPGRYTVTVTDANNCSISKEIEVPVVEKPTVSVQTTKAGGCSTNGGEAVATVSKGKSPYSYFWSNDQNTATLANVAAGTYTLTVTDDNGCTTQSTVKIDLKTVVVSVSNIRTNQATVSFNALDVGANYRIEYRIVGQSSWSSINAMTNTSVLLTGLSANMNYQVRVVALCANNNGESISNIAQFTTAIAVNTPPSVSITSPTNNATFTAPATITINATATDADGTISRVEFYNGAILLGTDNSVPYQFTWQNVTAGRYTLTAKAIDNLGASTTSIGIAIIVNAPIVCTTVVAITTTPKCPISSSTIMATATQGTAPYTYRWNTGSTAQTLTNVPFGTYTVTVTDSKGCISTKSITTSAVYCPMNYDPVCGSDGKTYSNACAADCAGVTWTKGECIVRDPNLLLYLPFNGNANDASGNNFHGTVSGAQLTTDRFGVANSAYIFNGTNNYMSIADNNLLDIRTADYTMSFWIKTTSTTPGRIFSKGSSGCTTGYMVRTGGPNASNIHLENAALGTCRINYYGNKIINDGVWHCVVCTIQRNGSASIYVDGFLDKQILLNTAGLDLSNNLNITLGVSHVTGLPEWFRGSLDEVRLHSKILSTQEIANFCNAFVIHRVKPIDVTIYPNPTKPNSILNIAYEATTETEVTITLEDFTGRTISTHKDKSFKGDNIYKLDIPNLSRSIYIVRLQQEKEVFIRKLIVL